MTLISEHALGKLDGASGGSGNCKEKQMNEQSQNPKHYLRLCPENVTTLLNHGC